MNEPVVTILEQVTEVTVLGAGLQILALGIPGVQGPAGTGGGGGAAATYAAQNVDAVTFAPGAPVGVAAGGTGAVRARASDTTRPAVGLATLGAAPGFAEQVQASGPLTLPSWTGATGAAALVPGSLYFVDPATPGKLTRTVPAVPGQVAQSVGIAVSTTTLEIDVEPGILL